MRTIGLIFAAVALVLVVVPTALALDSFPQDSQWGARDAHALVRLPQGGRLHVETEPSADVTVALAEPGADPGAPRAAPAEFDVFPREPEASWHGLPGTVELVLHRADAGKALEVFVEDEDGGAVFEWPAEAHARGIPAPGGVAILTALAGVAVLARSRGKRLFAGEGTSGLE